MTTDQLIVKLEKLTYGGDAFGRLSDGRAVFIPFGLPGETVRARIVDEKRGHVRAELVEFLEPSLERILPRCKHFGICGGCHYQQLPYPEQQKAKTEAGITAYRHRGRAYVQNRVQEGNRSKGASLPHG